MPVMKDKPSEIVLQECKRGELNLLFSRLNIESQTMQTQKDALEIKIEESAQEKIRVKKAK